MGAPDDALFRVSDTPSGPQNNVMLHAYRDLDRAQADQLQGLKDLYLGLWHELRMIDGSSADPAEGWNRRELGLAATRLEESLLWIEKAFLG